MESIKFAIQDIGIELDYYKYMRMNFYGTS